MQDRREQLWLLVDLLIVAWLCWLFDAINNLAPVRQALAVRDGERVLDLERSLGLDPEHALNAWLASRHALSEVVVFWYENVHIVVTLVVFAWLWWRRPDLLGLMRATLVLVNLIALAVFWSFPVAPPRMLSAGYSTSSRASRAAGLADRRDGAALQPALLDALAAHRLGDLVVDRDLEDDRGNAGCARSRSSIRC